MRLSVSLQALSGIALLGLAAASPCISSGDETTINNALSAGGTGVILQLCPNTTLTIYNTITFTADNQEISTEGYPTDNSRATILLSAVGTNVTELIQGADFSGIRLLNIQVDGDRPNNGPLADSGANIEIGGVSDGQIVKYVASRNPRGWSCLHITEGWGGSGSGACVNATVAYNDIGPCGDHAYDAEGNGLWADGISFACSHSVVSDNQVRLLISSGVVELCSFLRSRSTALQMAVSFCLVPLEHWLPGTQSYLQQQNQGSVQ